MAALTSLVINASARCRCLARPLSSAAVGAIELPAQALRLEVAGPYRENRLKLVFLPVLHGRLHGPGSGEEAAEAIRALRPQQVLVELCPRRYGEVLAMALLGLPARPPSKLDILGNVHGGLLQHELVPVLKAARAAGASVVPVDRPRTATRSRIAQRLWHPKLIQGLLNFGGYSLRRQRDLSMQAVPGDADELRRELERQCPAAHDVLIDERGFYLAHQVSCSALPGVEAVVVCSAPLCEHLVSELQRMRSAESPQAGANQLLRLARRGVPVWPLYVFAYAIVPVGLVLYAGSSAWESLAPALFDEEQPVARTQ